MGMASARSDNRKSTLSINCPGVNWSTMATATVAFNYTQVHSEGVQECAAPWPRHDVRSMLENMLPNHSKPVEEEGHQNKFPVRPNPGTIGKLDCRRQPDLGVRACSPCLVAASTENWSLEWHASTSMHQCDKDARCCVWCP